MSLQFLYGPASANHLEGIAEKVIELQNKFKNKAVYYLVPNHIKFQSEIQLLKMLRQKQQKDLDVFAQKDVQILSFTRLAWFFLKDTEIYQYPRITESSRNMILYKVILDHQDELQLFHNIDNQIGLLSEIARQINELKKGNVLPEDLLNITQNISQDENVGLDLTSKLHDLSIIYTAYDEEVQSRFVDNSDILRILTEEISKHDLSGESFLIGGFSNFAAEEVNLIHTLMKSNAEVVLDLNIDELPTENELNRDKFFFENAKLAVDFQNFAKESAIEVHNPVKLTSSRVNNDLLKLEKYWIDSTNGITNPTVESIDKLNVFKANSRYVEVRKIATTIRQKMAANDDIKFSDFAILANNLSDYETIIKPIFDQMDLPIFFDLEIKMKNHPLLELLNALFDIKKRFYRYEDVMRLLKTGLLVPEDVDTEDFFKSVQITENYVLKEGIYGKRWLQKDPWQYRKFTASNETQESDDEKEINRRINLVKDFVVKLTSKFYNELSVADNGISAAKALYDFLIDNGVDIRLMAWRDEWIADGDLARAAEPEQTWETFIQMLDEYVDILGDRDFSSDNFIGLLNAGFDSATFSQIPSTLDQILISESGMAQMFDRKFVFIMGANDRQMPEQSKDNGYLNDDAKESIGEYLNDEQFLNMSCNRQMKQAPYLNYLTFMMGSEELTFSYAMAGEGIDNVDISPYVKRLVEHFGLEDKIKQPCDLPTIDVKDTMQFVGSRRSTLSHLIQYAYDVKQKKAEFNPDWNSIYQILKQGDQTGMVDRLLSSLSYKNIPEKLKPEIVQNLYNDQLYTSVSQLEEFYRNEYAYFLKFGLKLRERETADLSPAETGQYFHAAMENLVKIITQKNINLNEITQSEINSITKQLIDELNNSSDFVQFNHTNRMGYLRRQLDETIQSVVEATIKQLTMTHIRPIAAEQMFGFGQAGLPALNFKIDDEHQIKVRGKIDRIDKIDLNGRSYLGVVDYKSSTRSFDFEDAYYGLAMQMLMYVDVLQNNAYELTKEQKTDISGALYMFFQNPLLKAKAVNGRDIQSEIFQQFKLKGLLLNDEDLLKETDKVLYNALQSPSSPKENPWTSKILPIGFKKDATLNAASLTKTVTSDELQSLVKHAEFKVKEAGRRIFSGELLLNPLKKGNQTALQYSPYKEVMQFDAMLPENNYHILDKLSKEDVLNKIEEEQS